jgi:hypothetical protein
MARISTIQIADRHVPQNEVGAYGISLDFSIGATEADNGDRLTLFEFQRAGYLHSAAIAISGTLGAACTIALSHSNAADDAHVALTGATAATTADREESTRGIRFAAGDMLSVLVGGGDIAAAATLQLDALISHNPVIAAGQLES